MSLNRVWHNRSGAAMAMMAATTGYNQARIDARAAWSAWYNKPWNKIRAWAASIMFGKKGWKHFHKAYYETAVDLRVRQIENQIPDTWLKAIHHMPEWIQLITESEHKSAL